MTSAIEPAVGCHCFLWDPRLPSPLHSVTAFGRYWLLLSGERGTCVVTEARTWMWMTCLQSMTLKPAATESALATVRPIANPGALQNNIHTSPCHSHPNTDIKIRNTITSEIFSNNYRRRVSWQCAERWRLRWTLCTCSCRWVADQRCLLTVGSSRRPSSVTTSVLGLFTHASHL